MILDQYPRTNTDNKIYYGQQKTHVPKKKSLTCNGAKGVMYIQNKKVKQGKN